MVKLSEAFPKDRGQIETTDVLNIKNPLTISETEMTGERKKSLWLSFEDSPLRFRLNKKTIFALCKHFAIDDTDDLEGKDISFIVKDGEVAIKEITEEPKKKK